MGITYTLLHLYKICEWSEGIEKPGQICYRVSGCIGIFLTNSSEGTVKCTVIKLYRFVRGLPRHPDHLPERIDYPFELLEKFIG